MLTKRQLEVLQQMAKAYKEERWEDAEIVSEGIVAYLGDERISCRTCTALMEHVLISLDDLPGQGGFRRWTINGTGLLVAENPGLADQVWLAVRGKRPFSVTKDGIIYLDEVDNFGNVSKLHEKYQ